MKTEEYDERQEITEYIWRWCQDELTQAEKVLGQAVISARPFSRRKGYSPGGPEADAAIIRDFEEAWARLEQEAADSERWAEPSVYRQLERKRPNNLPSRAELLHLRLHLRLQLQDIEELKSDPLSFPENVTQRLITSGQVEVARCPTCNRVLVSPRAKQCLWCHTGWHLSKEATQTTMRATSTIETTNREDNRIQQTLCEWLDLPYRRDADYLMTVHEADLPQTCIRLLAEIPVNVCTRDCEHFDGDYRLWAQGIQRELSVAPIGVLFLVNLNYQPEDVQCSLRAFWLNSMTSSAEQRLAFSFTPVNQTTAHLQRFNVAMPFFARRAIGFTISTE